MFNAVAQPLRGRVPTHPVPPLVGEEMSVQAISWVLSHSKSKLGARLVLLSIANHARDDGTGAWPSIATISKEAHISERQVQYSIRILQKIGEVQRQERVGPYGTNMYSLPMMGGAKSAPGDVRRGAVFGSGGCSFRREGVQSSSPNPSLTVPKDKEAVLFAIEESHRTGEDANAILNRIREGKKC